MGSTGQDHVQRESNAGPSYIPSGDPGRFGGGTYTAQDVEPTLEAYENIFGPSARDIKQDLQRFKRHGRWHLPDILKGPNTYLTDRIDGLISDAKNSPFTSRILPYKYITNVDGKIKWNVWSFDEGLASRVPYESAARVLTQTKRSYSGYTVRQGMALVLEHNFMMTEEGRGNFKNQLNQLVGSIQQTNDLDVHTALVLAPSAAKEMRENYMSEDKTPTQVCRQFIEMFGFMQKNVNALDIMIEEAKDMLNKWEGPMPDFMLCNSKMTYAMTMTPDVTNYVTQGPAGPKRLKEGPHISSYRGIDIIHTRAFSMETGAPPRCILRRRVRVAEYSRIAPHPDNYKRIFSLYNEERDGWFNLTFQDLLRMSLCNPDAPGDQQTGLPGMHNNARIQSAIEGLNRIQRDREAVAANARNRAQFGGLGTAFGSIPVVRPDRRIGLGVMMQDPGSQQLSQQLTDFFVHVFDRDLMREFTWQPIPIASGILYVPGAFDYLDTHCNDLANNLADLTPVIAQAFRSRNTNKFDPTDHNTPHMIDFMAQSVARYPRDVRHFVEGIDGRALLPASPYYVNGSGAFHGVADEIPGFDNTNPVSRRFCHSVMLRNYNRYGIPSASIQAPFGSANATTYDMALNLSADPGQDMYGQHLRNAGAFIAPNHYKNHTRPNYASVGDQLGYNCVLTHEFVNLLTRRSGPAVAAGPPGGAFYIPHIDTLLYDIVSNPTAHTALLTATRALLDTAVAYISARPANEHRRRLELGHHLLNALTAPIHAHAHALGYLDGTSHNGALVHYWMWPRTTRLEEDVFHPDNRTPLAMSVKGVNNLIHHVNLTHGLLDYLTGNNVAATAGLTASNAGDPFTQAVNVAGYTAATEADATNFYHMLAWRLWADQEMDTPPGVGPTGREWGSPQRYLAHDIHPPAYFGGGLIPVPDGSRDFQSPESMGDIEIVILRPNIEHYMNGIILGKAGEGLGSTFWGQTELAVYDDSMYGIWGMAYKYNERAIVINTRALIRLWDVGYDSYVGGKTDSYVDWNDESETNPDSHANLREYTMHVSRHYRGPSMLVMAFHHGEQHSQAVRPMYASEFKTNWPSPIVFYDDRRAGARKQLAVDFDNIHVIDTEEFRVFNKRIYHNAYTQYRAKMPDFEQLHRIRKNAGLAASENEVSSDALAFQGTMKVMNADGRVVADIQGSGHHGLDFVGVASLRNGKGYKLTSQPSQVRLT